MLFDVIGTKGQCCKFRVQIRLFRKPKLTVQQSTQYTLPHISSVGGGGEVGREEGRGKWEEEGQEEGKRGRDSFPMEKGISEKVKVVRDRLK